MNDDPLPEALDRERVEKLSAAFMETIKANYLAGPVSRDRVLESLNALAITVAHVVAGARDPEGLPLEFFTQALNKNLKDLSRRLGS